MLSDKDIYNMLVEINYMLPDKNTNNRCGEIIGYFTKIKKYI